MMDIVCVKQLPAPELRSGRSHRTTRPLSSTESSMKFLHKRSIVAILAASALATLATAALVNMTLVDFHLSGTQIGDVLPGTISTSDACTVCHAGYDTDNSPYDSWNGSLMAQAGRDPLFFAQMTNANQDVDNVGYYCLRCHVPLSFVTGHANQADGSTLDATDKDGVSCHFCHAMVDPIYQDGISPPEDVPVLAGLTDVPGYYADSMFVLDPSGLRRGPRADAMPPHQAIYSEFHKSGDFCGTCHDVGNVAVTKQPDGTYQYNAFDTPTPNEDPHTQFPLERTYTEWKLSAFANGGVDMGGRFGGEGVTVVSSCQDCHMPRANAQAALGGPVRSDLALHTFAGASSWVLKIIGLNSLSDPAVDQAALLVGQQKADEMLRAAATVRIRRRLDHVRVRVTNHAGHKIPTGHIEGRRIFLNVQFFNAGDVLVQEYGHYDYETAHLDEASTKVYEMHVGLSSGAAAATGLPEGVTTHMALANTIEKDNRIPPRGFNNATYEAGGAPAVGTVFADGQHWDDTWFSIPTDAVRVKATIYYQTVTRHYIEALRNGNVTNNWGRRLWRLYQATDMAPPIEMATREKQLR